MNTYIIDDNFSFIYFSQTMSFDCIIHYAASFLKKVYKIKFSFFLFDSNFFLTL